MTGRMITLAAAVLLMLAMVAGPAAADHDPTPEHSHVLLLHVQETSEGLTYRKCVDLAGGNPNDAHHHSVHTGTAGFGDPSRGITRAGHIAIPLGLIMPGATCDDLPPVLS